MLQDALVSVNIRTNRVVFISEDTELPTILDFFWTSEVRTN